MIQPYLHIRKVAMIKNCPLYATQRATLIASVTAIVQKYNLEILINQSHLYLYGHRIIVFADNKQIILSTINFIKETRRFSTTLFSIFDLILVFVTINQ